ncbi:CHAT domain-containing protein [Flammeovirga kamogawensis]|uniref:CHAT domain-containing protein n=1 Tax=Flammeovirga kamogawensis TaxID=373891 RepID=A0ABX8GQG0_9BACT|nr:CHAT domain-containing tetratricopeptide repeat protein [Flammeovirga kamogawensis]MBB6462001.1 CHAT domain-containing protein [Flammeovirga kamogawensis]QWG05741.1 CHAT domain-containing protein [Flammeovirga kamogawensis]TRX67567.1 CHAT domain-containing protein [Flammeovirga kamogawensis]
MNILLRSLLFVTIFSSLNGYANDIELKQRGIKEFYRYEFDKSIETFLELTVTTENKDFIVFAYNAIGHIYGKEKLDFKKGIHFLRKSFKLLEKDIPFRSHQLNAYGLLGKYYYQLGKLDSAEYYYKQGILFNLKKTKSIKSAHFILNNLQHIFTIKHEYTLSKEILNNVILSNEKISYTFSSNNLHLKGLLGDKEDVDSTYNSIISSPKKNKGIHHYHYGTFLQKNKLYTKAITLYQKFLIDNEAYFNDSGDFFYSQDEIFDHYFFKARAHLNISNCYYDISDKKKRNFHLNEALEYYHKAKKLPNQRISILGANIYRTLCNYSESNKKQFLDAAQAIIDESIKIQGDTSDGLKYELMIQNYYYGKHAKSMVQKEKYYRKSYQLFKKFITHQHQDEDQLFHIQELRYVQDEWVDFFTAQYESTKDQKYLLDAIEIIENLKSSILNRRSLGIKNITFKQYLDNEELLLLKKDRVSNSSLLSSEKIIPFFQTHYLDKSFISYHLNNNKIYCISYNEANFYLKVIPRTDKLNENLNTILKNIQESNYFLPNQFLTSLNEISKVLLPEWIKTTNNQRLVISQSGLLNKLPFEILKFNNKYLVENHAVSYSFSLHHDLVSDTFNSDLNSSLNVFSAAPFANINLPYSKQEALNIGNETLINENANYENIHRMLMNESFDILHFATHTKINNIPQRSCIELYPLESLNVISFSEIENLKLTSVKLVILSSCKSADGAFLEGEGNMSLQRAFAYAKIPSIIAGKWNVNDQVSLSVITSFYNYLKEGWEKDIALQKAKKDFIYENKILYNNPMFWGSLVLNGNSSAIVKPSLKTSFLKMIGSQ